MRTWKRMSRSAALLLLPIAVVGTTLYVAQYRRAHATAVNANCFGSLTATTYPSGVASAALASNTSVAIQPGTGLQLDTNLTPFNAQNITLPFDQQIDVKYVYRNAGASHAFGWFYLDQILPFIHLDTTQTPPAYVLNDNDNDGIYDWFETKAGTTRPLDGLWHQTTAGTPDLLNSGMGYSDGGAYPHMPNILEGLTGPGKGSMIFKLCDDDGDTSSWTGDGSTEGSYPINDSSTLSDGIPDYDVNGDGIVANEADREVNLGVIQGNREMVFFMMTYYGTNLPQSGLGLGTSTSSLRGTYATPLFTKNILNPDRNTLAPGTLLDRCAIKCLPQESFPNGSPGDVACKNAAAGGPATNGWLTPDAQARLNTATYNYTDISNDPAVYNIVVAPDGTAPHFVVLPPASNPNLWLIGYEDLPNNQGDNDYNDVVFMVERANGGQVVSQVVSNIPTAQQATTVISEVSVQYNISFPAPGCTGVTGESVKLYYSVDNGVTWAAVPMASATTGDVTIDVLGAGLVGSQLKWRADFSSPVQACQPVLNNLNIGYEAVANGIFKYAAPIPLSNMVYGGALETPQFPATEPTPTRSDYSLRGHFYGTELYDPVSYQSLPTPVQQWDSGAVMSQASQSPDNRKIYTSIAGLTKTFDTTNGTSLYPQLLSVTDRTATSNATLVYDYTGDNVVDDNDAQFLLQWTRGWEYPPGLTMIPTPPSGPQMRAWRLGSVHNSSPAIVGPPVRPVWIDGVNAPPTLVAAHNTFLTNNQARNTISVVGSQDGLVHAFDSGWYRPTGDADKTELCTNTLYRGCFAGTPPNYGVGKELWAWLPPSQITQLKNNTPTTKNYLPGSNPIAEVDGSVSVEDIYDQTLNAGSGGFRTMAYASLGVNQRYISAIDITNPTPAAVWPTDFTDPDFNGANLSPSVGLVNLAKTAVPPYHEMVVTSSGLNTIASDEYIYLLDALTGAIMQKIQLNTTPYTAQATGIASYVNMVDADGDGLVDRIYAADTSGRIWKVDTTTNQKCLIASLGETVYAGMAIEIMSTSTSAAPNVELFVGGGSNPDGTGTVASVYDFFEYEDDDPVGTCTNGHGKVVSKTPLPPGEKIWAAPTVSDTSVFVATANAASTSVCASGTGYLDVFPTTGDGSGGAVTATQPAISLTGAPISSMRVYDGHVMVNTVGGSTTVIGGSSWNNKPNDPNLTNVNNVVGLLTLMKTVLWQEQ